MNIVSMAMGYLAPKVVSKIAKSMGIPEGIATSLIGMALPSILGGLTGSSRSSAGAGALFDAVSKMTWGGGNSNPLEAALDVGGAADFAQSGGGMLAGLMGEARRPNRQCCPIDACWLCRLPRRVGLARQLGWQLWCHRWRSCRGSGRGRCNRIGHGRKCNRVRPLWCERRG